MHGTLKKKGFLSRWIEVETPEGRFEVVYQGFHLGFEQVLVGGQVAVREESFYWFVPTFVFGIGSLPARIEVQVWPWLAIKSLKLRVAGFTVYEE